MIWFFAFVDGGFRYVGNVRPSAIWTDASSSSHQTANGAKPKRIRIGGEVVQSRLLHRKEPTYPKDAQRAGIEGTVRLEAVIGVDGRVHQISLMEGHCSLVDAAVQAVRHWRYKPTLLNGSAVEVLTIIDIVFKLKP